MTRIQPPAGWSLDPIREQQVREWAAKLGASTSADSVGPYSALCDALAEIDRLRAELEQAQQQTAAAVALPIATADELRRMDPQDYQRAKSRSDTLAEVRRLLTTAPAAVPGA